MCEFRIVRYFTDTQMSHPPRIAFQTIHPTAALEVRCPTPGREEGVKCSGEGEEGAACSRCIMGVDDSSLVDLALVARFIIF